MWEESSDSSENISEELYKNDLVKTKVILALEKEEECTSQDNLVSYCQASENNSLGFLVRDQEE